MMQLGCRLTVDKQLHDALARRTKKRIKVDNLKNITKLEIDPV